MACIPQISISKEIQTVLKGNKGTKKLTSIVVKA